MALIRSEHFAESDLMANSSSPMNSANLSTKSSYSGSKSQADWTGSWSAAFLSYKSVFIQSTVKQYLYFKVGKMRLESRHLRHYSIERSLHFGYWLDLGRRHGLELGLLDFGLELGHHGLRRGLELDLRRFGQRRGLELGHESRRRYWQRRWPMQELWWNWS